MKLRDFLIAMDYRDSYDWIFEFEQDGKTRREGCGWGLDPKNEFKRLLDYTVYSFRINETYIEVKLYEDFD